MNVFACRPCECGGHPDCPDCDSPTFETWPTGATVTHLEIGGVLIPIDPVIAPHAVSPCPCEGGDSCVCQ